jgi:hypothetical protein
MMQDYPWKELLVDKNVNYVMEEDGELVIIEKVPARVNPETGEQLLSSKTLQRLREMIKERKSPIRVIETPIYEFPA